MSNTRQNSINFGMTEVALNSSERRRRRWRSKSRIGLVPDHFFFHQSWRWTTMIFERQMQKPLTLLRHFSCLSTSTTYCTHFTLWLLPKSTFLHSGVTNVITYWFRFRKIKQNHPSLKDGTFVRWFHQTHWQKWLKLATLLAGHVLRTNLKGYISQSIYETFDLLSIKNAFCSTSSISSHIHECFIKVVAAVALII